jgi:hypothetical protein
MRGRRGRVTRSVLLLMVVAGGLSACSGIPTTAPTIAPSDGVPPFTGAPSGTAATLPPSPASASPTPTATVLSPRAVGTPAPPAAPRSGPRSSSRYPWHTDIPSTTFWVGEIFDPNASDGSQVLSTYNGSWLRDYGGCDGRMVGKDCRTERRTAADDWFPTAMTPKENPFYLDLPFDDVNDAAGVRTRAKVIPWARQARYASRLHDRDASMMKNRWVELRKGGRTCFGQIEDAGPGQYHDARYVFGHDDARPANRRYGGAGLDVSPALNGCLGYAELDGDGDRVSWRFVDDRDVPAGPWTRIVTTSGVH